MTTVIETNNVIGGKIKKDLYKQMHLLHVVRECVCVCVRPNLREVNAEIHNIWTLDVGRVCSVASPPSGSHHNHPH